MGTHTWMNIWEHGHMDKHGYVQNQTYMDMETQRCRPTKRDTWMCRPTPLLSYSLAKASWTWPEFSTGRWVQPPLLFPTFPSLPSSFSSPPLLFWPACSHPPVPSCSLECRVLARREKEADAQEATYLPPRETGPHQGLGPLVLRCPPLPWETAPTRPWPALP